VAAVHKKVVIQNKIFKRFDGPYIMFSQIVDGYDYRPWYQDQVRDQLF